MTAPDAHVDAGQRDRFVWRQDELDEALALGGELLHGLDSEHANSDDDAPPEQGDPRTSPTRETPPSN